MDVKRQRARSDTAKRARRTAIIEATMARLDAHGLHAVSMQDIANACGLTKPALYSYFRAREELFLAVYRRLMRDWLTDFNRSLLTAGHPLPRATFNSLFVSGFAARPLLCHLTNHLTATLAPRLTASSCESLKAETSDQLAGLRSLLVHYGYADADNAGDLAWAYYTILVGAAQIANWPAGMARMKDGAAQTNDRAAFEANCLATLACLR
jgi:AcrR family transcriptional regulator